MFTSASEEWETPADFFKMLDDEFHFDLDVCATDANAKCPLWIDKDTDALRPDVWWGVGDMACWMNPPYGNTIGHWVHKARTASLAGPTIVCLIPARTDTAYWHDYVMFADEVRFVRGRLQFGGPSATGHNAPFPCAVVVFRPWGLMRDAIGHPHMATMPRRPEER